MFTPQMALIVLGVIVSVLGIVSIKKGAPTHDKESFDIGLVMIVSSLIMILSLAFIKDTTSWKTQLQLGPLSMLFWAMSAGGLFISTFGILDRNKEIRDFGLPLLGIGIVGIFLSPNSAQAQPIIGNQVNYSTGKYSVLAQPGVCDERTCKYTINVYVSNEEGDQGVFRQNLVAVFENNYSLIRTLSPGCFELIDTDDFAGLADLPLDAGPRIPLVICKCEGRYYDGTSRELTKGLSERLAVLLKNTSECRATRDCLSDKKTRSAIVELHIIKIMLRRAEVVAQLPENWRGGVTLRDAGQLELTIERILNTRLDSHVPSMRK